MYRTSDLHNRSPTEQFSALLG